MESLIDRSHLTAPHRTKLSKSILYLIRSRKLSRSTSFLDYGCGHGFEFQYLRSLGYDANGYDPHYFPEYHQRKFDVVTFLHVLNVIPELSDRVKVLQDAYSKCTKVLVVASRSPQPCVGAEYLDGKVTRHGWFNKCYSDNELKIFCSRSLGIDANMFRRIAQKSFVLHK